MTTYETPYLLQDGRVLVLVTTKPDAPANFGLIDAKIYSKECYDEYVAQVIAAASKK